MPLEERMPLFKKLTSLTGGENAEADQDNLMAGLRHQLNYTIISAILMDLLSSYEGIGPDSLEVTEGFVSRRLAERNGLEVQDDDSYEFRNVVFSVAGMDPDWVVREALPQICIRNGYGAFIKLVRLDVQSGLILMKAKEDTEDQTPCAFEVEDDGVVTRI